jgi:hypothetical protein
VLKKRFVLVCIAAIVLLSSLYTYADSTDVHPIIIPGLLSTAKQLDNTGTVEEQSPTHRYIYLKLSQEHVDKLYPLLKNDLPFVMRNCLRKDKNQIGAHITLFEPENITPEMWPKVKALLGKQFSFTVKKVNIIFMKKMKGKDAVRETWFTISLDAPELKAALEAISPNDPYFQDLHYSIAISRRLKGRCYYSNDTSP